MSFFSCFELFELEMPGMKLTNCKKTGVKAKPLKDNTVPLGLGEPVLNWQEGIVE